MVHREVLRCLKSGQFLSVLLDANLFKMAAKQCLLGQSDQTFSVLIDQSHTESLVFRSTSNSFNFE